MRLARGKGGGGRRRDPPVRRRDDRSVAARGILPAYVEIMLAVGSLDLARAACRELERPQHVSTVKCFDAMAAHARGAMELAEGRTSDALIELRRALAIWRELTLPMKSRASGQSLAWPAGRWRITTPPLLELEAARAAFGDLGAAPDCARVASLDRRDRRGAGQCARADWPRTRGAATGRGREEQPRDRRRAVHQRAHGRPHVQNIFAKLAVSSRTAATAFAFSHELV